jgi:predicted GNAT family acetyltransferase
MTLPTAKDKPPVRQNVEASRFEIQIDGYLAVLEYQEQEGRFVFTHTGVPASLEGQGIGSRLAHAGLEFTRKHGLKVVPLCSFIAGYMRRHPEYLDLLDS